MSTKETLSDVFDPPLDRRIPEHMLGEDGRPNTVRTRRVTRVVRDDDGRATRVTAAVSSYRTGVNPASGARYWRWETTQGSSTRLTRSGRMIHTVFEGGYAVTETVFCTRQLTVASPETIIEHLGLPKPADECYPLAEHYGLLDWIDDPGFRSAFESTSTVAELAVRLYGKRALRKSLVKAVAQASIYPLYLSWCLRRRDVPVDWHVDFLRAHPMAPSGPSVNTRGQRVRGLRPHLRGLDRSSVRRLLRQERLPLDLIGDIGRMHSGTGITQARSWEDLHDRVARDDRRVRQAEYDEKMRLDDERRTRRLNNPAYIARMEEQARRAAAAAAERQRREEERAGVRAVLHKDLAAKLDGATTRGGQTLVVATDARQLLEWGNALDNCIGSYANSLRLYTAVLVAVYEADAPIGALEIRLPVHDMSGALVLGQSYGRRNGPLPPEVQSGINEVLRAAGVDLDLWDDLPRAS